MPRISRLASARLDFRASLFARVGCFSAADAYPENLFQHSLQPPRARQDNSKSVSDNFMPAAGRVRILKSLRSAGIETSPSPRIG
jgi:hypothetical protein